VWFNIDMGLFVFSFSFSETELSSMDVNVPMTTSDSATHMHSMDTDNISNRSVFRDARGDEIQICLRRLLALMWNNMRYIKSYITSSLLDDRLRDARGDEIHEIWNPTLPLCYWMTYFCCKVYSELKKINSLKSVIAIGVIRLRRMHEMQTIVTDDLSISLSVSHVAQLGFAVQK